MDALLDRVTAHVTRVTQSQSPPIVLPETRGLRFRIGALITAIVVLIGVGAAGGALAFGLLGPAALPAPSTSSAASTPEPVVTQTAIPSEAPTPTPGSTDEDSGQLLRLSELIEAVEAAGVACDDFAQDDSVAGATGSGWCVSANVGLSTYVDTESRDHVLDLNASSLEPGIFLVGPNWLVAPSIFEDGYEQLASLQASMGGEIWGAH